MTYIRIKNHISQDFIYGTSDVCYSRIYPQGYRYTVISKPQFPDDITAPDQKPVK